MHVFWGEISYYYYYYRECLYWSIYMIMHSTMQD